jgi:hypothetical protein
MGDNMAAALEEQGRLTAALEEEGRPVPSIMPEATPRPWMETGPPSPRTSTLGSCSSMPAMPSPPRPLRAPPPLVVGLASVFASSFPPVRAATRLPLRPPSSSTSPTARDGDTLHGDGVRGLVVPHDALALVRGAAVTEAERVAWKMSPESMAVLLDRHGKRPQGSLRSVT